MEELYYGIAIPPDIENLDPNLQLELKSFYSDRAEVMKILKGIKTARFKVFKNKEDAIQFSGTHVVSSVVTVSDSVLLSSPKPSEKCEFKSLKPQEEVKFRKAIEANPSDLAFLVTCIEENARYLVTPSDTPTILQQGQRHNALHAAARHGKLEAARLVLAQVTGGLMARMYPEEDRAMNSRRREFLVDMYLNMPDKGGGDTPLHLAVKFGHLAMVRLLCSYHQTRTDMTNKFGEQAASVVCSRAKENDPDKEREIREILEGQLVIPVYRGTEGKQLGRPISLREASELLEQPRSPEVSSRLSADTSLTSSDMGSPLVQSSRARVSASVPASPLSTSISAVMGPVTPSQARSLYRTWRTGSEGDTARERLGDPDLAAERQGRDLACREGVMWTEWWPWLGDYCDLGTEAGLGLLERHLELRTRETRERLDMEYQEDIEDEFESSIAAGHHEDDVFSGELEIVSRVSSSTPAKTSSWSTHRSSSVEDSLDNEDLDTSDLNITDKNGNPTKSGREPLSPLSSLMSGFDNMNIGSDNIHLDSGDSRSQELANLTTPPTKLQHSLSNDVMRTLEQFVSAAVTLLVDSVPDTDLMTPECDLDWVRPLASHWSVLRRQVNNWRSDPANRWAGLDWPGVGGTLVEMMGDQITLELGTGLERERLARMMDVVARTEEADTEDRVEEHDESYERGRRRRGSGPGSGARDLSRLCHLVSSVLLSPSSDPCDLLEAASGLWELDTGKSCVRTSNVNRARRFLHSGSTSSGQSGSLSGPVSEPPQPPEPPIVPCHQPGVDTNQSNRRDSLSSQSSQESQGAWQTPPTSPGASSVASMETCSEGLTVWVQGEGPTVQDRRLAEALAHVSQHNLVSFPHVSWYLAHVSSFSSEQQRLWAEVETCRPYGSLVRKLDLDFTI